MAIQDQVRRFSVIAIILLLVLLTYFVLKPIILSVIAGLLLAYAFFPIYKKIFKIFRERNTTALAVCVIILLIIFIPLWFLIPLIIQQAFDLFLSTQDIDVRSIVETLFPAASDNFRQDTTAIIIKFIGDITSNSIKSLTGFLLNLPNVLLHVAVLVFVFFFTLRDHDKLSAFVSGLSPFKKEKEKVLATKFKEITSSIVYGYIIVGIIQGIATGIGLLIFGVPQPLILTIVAIFASILPMIGPWLIWIPAAVFLLIQGEVGAAVGFSIYSIIFVSMIDNILRPYIVSRKTGVHPIIVLVGMIGGLLVFGIMGILIGPLILSYLVMFLEAYKNKTLSDMFH